MEEILRTRLNMYKISYSFSVLTTKINGKFSTDAIRYNCKRRYYEGVEECCSKFYVMINRDGSYKTDLDINQGNNAFIISLFKKYTEIKGGIGMIINKIDNGALNVIKLEGQVNKADRYMSYNNILFTESRENPILVINEAKTGGFIICKSRERDYVVNLIKTNFKYIGYALSEYEGEEDSQDNIKINYEIRKSDSSTVTSEINLLNAWGDSVYRENNDDFHIFHNIRNDKNFTLVTALSNADKMRFNNKTKKFQSLVIYDQGRAGGILFTEHTRNGVVKARLRRVAEYYGMEVKIEADNEYIFSGCQTAVIRFEFVKPMPVLDLGIERPDATEYYRLVNDVLERIC